MFRTSIWGMPVLDWLVEDHRSHSDHDWVELVAVLTSEDY